MRVNQDCYCLVQLRKILSIILSIIAFGGEYFVKVLLKFAQVVFFVKGDVNYGEKSGNRRKDSKTILCNKVQINQQG